VAPRVQVDQGDLDHRRALVAQGSQGGHGCPGGQRCSVSWGCSMGWGCWQRPPWHRHPHTYRRARLPFLAWQPLSSIHDHPGLSLNEEREEKSVSPCALLCSQCRTGPQCHKARRLAGRWEDPGVTQAPSTRRCQGLSCACQGPRCSPGTPAGQPHAHHLPARLSPPSGQKAPSVPVVPGKERQE